MEAEVCSSSTHSPAPDASTKPERAKLQLSSSPPPNCAICLSDCDNKSFTDRCMHQFCFACLLRWSKVKAECPLCKQPFKSIIHTVRSNSDYEELAILSAQPPTEDHNHEDISVDFEQHYYLPTVSQPPRQRRFQYRTTLYLDPHEDIAIQQMLMSHPLTNTLLMPRRRLTRLIGSPRPANSLDFRHAIYQHNWWVNPVSTADITGRYRECSPQFYRDNPAQRNRIGPWLARELNALLNENGPHCLYVMSIINSLLIEYHVTSHEFKQRIAPYFGDKTDHFIHEFYWFLRSPYDMIGYDRNLQYTQRIQNIELGSSSSSSDSDSDVQVINTQPVSITISTPPPVTFDSNDVIVLSDSDSDDSDVIYREPTPPPVVTITDSEGPDDNEPSVPQINDNIPIIETSNSAEIEYKKENLSDTDSTPSNVDKTTVGNNDINVASTTKIESIDPEATISSDSSTSSSANDIKVKKNHSGSESSYKMDVKFSYKLKLKNNHKARRPKLRKYSSDSSTNDNNTSSSSDTESSNTSKSTNTSLEKKKVKRKRRKSITSNSSGKSDQQPSTADRRRSYTFRKKRRLQTVILTSSEDESDHENSNNNLPSTSFGNNNNSSPNSYLKYDDSIVSGASSSSSHPRLRSVIMKPNYNRCYNRAGVFSSSSDDD
ncbi:E3 ubiquitin-protein ligase Topors-like [Chrysoperla carnea]|uniref:E3 ubiquitin-protein ligase Topors-like n=1 Tax=Chrysoperla carnea TaxID=189513 RepID=UPI001D073C35|nr:E3 ubiquitin-protein ligase Topors-like [Chrysoperla carnea]